MKHAVDGEPKTKHVQVIKEGFGEKMRLRLKGSLDRFRGISDRPRPACRSEQRAGPFSYEAYLPQALRLHDSSKAVDCCAIIGV